MKRPLILLLALGSLILSAPANPPPDPAWWSQGPPPPVIDPNAAPNNKGPANIGQAKYMAKRALEALRTRLPGVADQVEADLVGAGKPIPTWDVPESPGAVWLQAQRAPLLIGQLKAISAPFYNHLNTAVATWLRNERLANGTDSAGTHLPWTDDPGDDLNASFALVGQLKAVFALRYERDSDQDGMPDIWEDFNLHALDSGPGGDDDDDGLSNLNEFQLGLNPSNADTDGDGMEDGWEVYYGFPANDATPRRQDKRGPKDDFNNNGWLNDVEARYGSVPGQLSAQISPYLHLKWFGKKGVVYRLESSADLQLWTHHGYYIGQNTEISLRVPDDFSITPYNFFRHYLCVGYTSENDWDGDGVANATEIAAGLDPFSGGDDSDNDGLPDGWELFYSRDLTTLDSASNGDGDWLDSVLERAMGTNPFVNDDVDMDGWLDQDESRAFTGGNVGDILPWGDDDGDGFANAREFAAGTRFLAGDTSGAPENPGYAPVIRLAAQDIANPGTVSQWGNSGLLGGVFAVARGAPFRTLLAGKPAVAFQAGTTPDCMVGPRVPAWMNGCGSRTIIAWIYNSSVDASDEDILLSWGAESQGAPTGGLFSCRYGGKPGASALSRSGVPLLASSWSAQVAPRQGQWSFVVFRYDQKTGNLLIMRDFEAAVIQYGADLRTTPFSNGKINPFVIGADHNGLGGWSGKTSLGVGVLLAYGEALPMSEILARYEETRSGYGGAALAGSDSDGIPDLLEVSLGSSPGLADSDLDGISDGAEFDQGTAPNDYYNGRFHSISLTGGDNQAVYPGGVVTTDPLVFKVTGLDGNPLQNAPVTARVITSPAAGTLGVGTNPTAFNAQVSSRTAADGTVRIKFKSN